MELVLQLYPVPKQIPTQCVSRILCAIAQTDKETALAKGEKAFKLMDEGQIEESIVLLKEAMKLDPDELTYPYEIGYAKYLGKSYGEASGKEWAAGTKTNAVHL